MLHQLKFHLRQVDLLAVAGQAAAADIELERAGAQFCLRLLLGAAHAYPAVNGIHPGHQLAGAKGLGDVVIGAQHQAVHLVHLLAFGGKHDDAQGIIFLPDMLADGKTVDAGHHDIQNGDRKAVALLIKDTDGILAAADINDLVAAALQIDDLKFTDGVLVLTDEYFAGCCHKFYLLCVGFSGTPWGRIAIFFPASGFTGGGDWPSPDAGRRSQ